ncbi:MAG: response regulator transcription factor [Bacteroidia bacterium]|nr:response regulator transcription factor [Bacteroidia bacterium]
MSKIKIGTADDHNLFRIGLVTILQENPEFEIVIQASNGNDLLAAIPQANPDIILLDLKMPIMDGIEAAEVIRDLFPDIRLIALSGYDKEDFVLHMMEKGINGFLNKNSEPEEVETAIYSVMENGFYFSERVSHVLVKGLLTKKRINPSFNTPVEFTEREHEILGLICREYTNREISDKLSISVRTVEGYRNNLLKKIGARNTAGLVVFAYKSGIID